MATIKEVTAEIEKKSEFIFVYADNTENLINRRVNITSEGQSVEYILNKIFTNTELKYRMLDKQIVVYREKPQLNTANYIPQSSQQEMIAVNGRVTDSKGELLIGVSVKIKNTSTGVITNSQGRFNITVSKYSDVLVFSYMGYEELQKQIESGKLMEVVMTEKITSLDEVVVVGYQDVKRKDLTGSVSSANVSEMIKAPVPNIDQALAGRVAGVMVTSGEGMPGQSMNIVIRGSNSISQDNSPLFVIDGFPTEDNDYISSINPRDIESIDILKDASAASIYGSRGANGVVIITTKKGKMGQLNITYDGSAGYQKIINKIPLMDAYEFVRLQEELRTPEEMSGKNGYYKTYEGKTWTLEDYRNIEQFDWQDLIFRGAYQQNHSLSLTGGNENNRYNASVSYTNQDGIIINSNYNRIQGRLGFNVKRNKLNLNLTANYSSIVNTGFSPSLYTGSSMLGLFYSVWGYRPVTQPGVDISSLLEAENDDAINQSFDSRFNPILTVKNEHRKYNRYYTAFNGFAEYELMKDLKLKISGNYTRYGTRLETFFNSKTRSGSPISINQVNASIAFSERHNMLNENTLTYNKKFNNHFFSGLIGNAIQAEIGDNYGFGTRMIPYESLGMPGMEDGEPFSNNASMTEWSMLSYFTRLNYQYKSKYYITGTVRSDGSSKFVKNNRFRTFPSLALAWNFTQESFFNNLKNVVDMGKLRFSWGQIGNNRIKPYLTNAQLLTTSGGSGTYLGRNDFVSGVYGFNNKSTNKGPIPINLPNEDLKWEITTQTNLGLDLTMLKDRLSFIIDLYHKKTTDLLLNSLVPFSSGYGGTTKNIGAVANTGLEFTVNGNILNYKNFKWNANFNIAFNKNKILSLVEDQSTYLEQAMISQEFASSNYIVKVGYPLGMMYGYIYDGTYKLDDFVQSGNVYTLKQGVAAHVSATNIIPGDQRFVDINGDGVVDNNDMTFIGRGTPIHVGGFNNTFEFYNFDLSVLFQWSYGSNVMNANKLTFETGRNTRDLNRFASYADRWSFDNQDSDIPAISSSSTNNLISTRVIEDGSYLRLKTLSLGYNVDPKFSKKIKVNRTRIYLSADNLITWTKYSGYDPEVSVRNSGITPGLDYFAYPRAYSVNAGLTINF